MTIKLQSHAKINLGLKINHKRDDNYHDISTLIQEIDLFDEITLTTNNSKKISIQSHGIKCPEDESNLCYLAAELFLKEFNINDGVSISIIKNIPIGSGLGGGSSNAVTVLKGLSKLFDFSIKKEHLLLICSKIGADTSFFINGGLQYATGIGNKLYSIAPLLNKYYILLVFPNISISTQWAYREYKKYLENQSNPSNFLPLSDQIDWSLLENDFEKVVLSTYPEIRRIKNDLQNSSSLFSSLSGSGSTMFGVYDSLESVRNFQDLFKQYQTIKALPVY